MEAIVERPNITSYVGYHTFSGVHLRPYSAHPDEDFPTPDLRRSSSWARRRRASPATRRSRSSTTSSTTRRSSISGGDVDWVYDFLGAFAWVTEFWSPQRAAGLADYHFIDWIREHPPEDDVALIKLADELGEGYVDWYPFEHPQLGPVELGGWDLVRFWFNPPLSRLEEEVRPHADFALFLALVSPRLEIRSFDAEAVGDGAYASASCSRTPAGFRQRHAEGDRPEGRAADRGRARAPRGRAHRNGEGARGGRVSSEGRVERRGCSGGGSTTRRATSRCWSGSSRRLRERRSASSPGTSARAPPAPSSSRRVARAMVLDGANGPPARGVRNRPAAGRGHRSGTSVAGNRPPRRARPS